MQKVDKKKILLISFEFSISITVLNGVKFGQFRPSRAKQGQIFAKQDQTRLNRLKWGFMVVNRGKLD